MPDKNHYKLFPQKQLLKYALFFIVSITIFLLFAFGEILILKQSSCPQLFSINAVSPARWEEMVCYLPFFKATGSENIWPDQPHVDAASTGVSHIPFISNMFGAIIYHFVCFGNNNAFLLLTHSLFPMLSFWFLYLIFRLHLGVSWSALLAFFSISYHSSYSFLKNSLIAMTGSTPFIPPSAPAEMSRIPFPAFSMLFFLIPFYLTLRSKGLKKSNREIFILTLLWGLQIHIYIYNFIAGIIFFTLWLFYHHYFACRHRKKSFIGKQLLFLFCSTLIISVPYLIKLNSLSAYGLIPHLATQTISGLQFSNWGFLTAYALPICLLLLAVYVQRADIFEFFHRFTPIFLIFATDLAIGLLCWLSDGLIGTELHYHRVSNIAFRFMWFVPLLYFISAPEKPLRRPQKQTLYKYRRYGRAAALLLHKFRTLISSCGILTTAVFLLCGGYANYYNHEINVVPVMRSTNHKIKILQKISPGIVFWEEPVDNLLTPIISSHNSIIAHSFSNLLPKEQLIERLVLYTRVFNWDEKKFLRFMLPGGKFSELTSFISHQTKISDIDLLNGFGFWCIYHRKKMNPTELNDYRTKILELYHSLNPVESLKKLSKTSTIHIISTKIPPIAAEISPLELTNSGEFFIFTTELKGK